MSQSCLEKPSLPDKEKIFILNFWYDLVTYEIEDLSFFNTKFWYWHLDYRVLYIYIISIECSMSGRERLWIFMKNICEEDFIA